MPGETGPADVKRGESKGDSYSRAGKTKKGGGGDKKGRYPSPLLFGN